MQQQEQQQYKKSSACVLMMQAAKGGHDWRAFRLDNASEAPVSWLNSITCADSTSPGLQRPPHSTRVALIVCISSMLASILAASLAAAVESSPALFIIAYDILSVCCWRSAFAGDGGSGLDFVKAFKQELGMQSNQLPAELRERVERAIAALGYRVTVGEVAAKAGVKLS